MDQGGDLNAADENGSNPLINATASGNLDLVRYLVDEQHADINYYDAEGFGAVTVAAYLGDIDTVRYVTGHRLYVPPPTRHHPLFAAASASLEVTRFLVDEAGAEVDEPGPHAWTPAMMAAKSGKAEVLQFLVASGASTDRLNDSLHTLEGVIATADVTERVRARLRNALENGTALFEQERTRRDVEEVRRAVAEANGGGADEATPLAEAPKGGGEGRSCRRACSMGGWLPALFRKKK